MEGYQSLVVGTFFDAIGGSNQQERVGALPDAGPRFEHGFIQRNSQIRRLRKRRALGCKMVPSAREPESSTVWLPPSPRVATLLPECVGLPSPPVGKARPLRHFSGSTAQIEFGCTAPG